MDQVESIQVELREKNIASTEQIKEATMRKVHGTTANVQTARKLSKLGVIAAIAAAVLCITAAAAVVMYWDGFAFTEGMSPTEKDALINEVSVAVAGEYEDADGMVHYLDADGNEVMVLTEDEAAAYEQKRLEAAEQAVADSTELIDAYTIPFMPNGITELPVESNGRFADCALGNASMILLHPAGEKGFNLVAGDRVTMKLTANDMCTLQFGQFLNGKFVRAETVTAQHHQYTFVIEEAGLYCFSVEYYSAGASTFMDGSITIN